MAVTPIAPGHPDYSSTGTSKWIPQIWSTKLVGKFYKQTVFAAICNTDYEGEIKNKGDKVIIRTTPEISIFDYQKGMDLTYSSYESANIEFPIDRGKYFAFPCDDVDKKQADINFLNAWADDAAMRMKIAVDREILAAMYVGIDSNNYGASAGKISGSYNMGTTGTPVGIDRTNVLEYLMATTAVLAEQDVPEEGRWIVIPVWMANLIKQSDLAGADFAGDGTSMLRNGLLGTIAGYKIYQSNNFTTVTDGANTCYHIPFGHPTGMTFAAQMTKTETLRNPRAFGDLIRSLMIYGFKIIRGESIGDLYCYNAS
jgi:hypothetical protein